MPQSGTGKQMPFTSKAANPRYVLAMQVLHIGVDVADAMEYLHPAVVHRDLKSQNSALRTASHVVRYRDAEHHPRLSGSQY